MLDFNKGEYFKHGKYLCRVVSDDHKTVIYLSWKSWFGLKNNVDVIVGRNMEYSSPEFTRPIDLKMACLLSSIIRQNDRINEMPIKEKEYNKICPECKGTLNILTGGTPPGFNKMGELSFLHECSQCTLRFYLTYSYTGKLEKKAVCP